MLNLKFIEIDTNPLKPKATIHATGRLGFNIDAIKYMNLSNRKNFRVAINDEDGSGLRNIYLIEEEGSVGVAKVSKAGDYFYLNVGDLFDRLDLNYKENTIIFDIKKEQYNDKDLFILKMRKLKRR